MQGGFRSIQLSIHITSDHHVRGHQASLPGLDAGFSQGSLSIVLLVNNHDTALIVDALAPETQCEVIERLGAS